LIDTSKVTTTGYIPRDTWVQAYKCLKHLIGLISTAQIKESLLNLSKKDHAVSEKDSEDGDHEELHTFADIEKAIIPGLANFIERLAGELLKAY
jgi:hypothetical protein